MYKVTLVREVVMRVEIMVHASSQGEAERLAEELAEMPPGEHDWDVQDDDVEVESVE